NACRHGELADRGLALLRLLAPIAIEDDPAVAAARAVAPSLPAYATLTASREHAARSRFWIGAIELRHRLRGGGGALAREGTGSGEPTSVRGAASRRPTTHRGSTPDDDASAASRGSTLVGDRSTAGRGSTPVHDASRSESAA